MDAVNRVSQATYEEWTRRAKPKEGDLILAREAPIGNVAVIPQNLKVCLGQRTVLIRPNREKVNSHFLLYLLLGNEIQNKFQAFSGGATVAHLNVEEIHKLELPKIPDRIIQEKIAAILSAYDDLIENNRRRIKILEEVAQSLFREWFVKFRFSGRQKVKIVNSTLGKIPEGWTIGNIGDLVEERKDRNRGSNNSPVLTVKNTRKFIHSEEYFSKRVYSESLKNYKEVRRGDFAYNPSRINIGSIAFQEDYEIGVVSPMYVVFSAKTELVGGHFLWMLLQQEEIYRQIVQLCSGTVRQIFKFKDFSLVKTVIPPKKIQSMFEEIVTPIQSQTKTLAVIVDNLHQTRDLLLPKLVSGELDVSELDITIPEAEA